VNNKPLQVTAKRGFVRGTQQQSKSMRKRYIIISILAIILIAYYFCLPRKLFNDPYSTVVEAKTGELLGARIADDSQWRFPECDTVRYK
jgi:penicillin-binding protein 1C